jgi:hypothetical protein
LVMRKYAMLKGFDQCEKFLLDHPYLCCDSTTSYLTIEALNMAIEYRVSIDLCYFNNLLILG